jgi:hypothetical protein
LCDSKQSSSKKIVTGNNFAMPHTCVFHQYLAALDRVRVLDDEERELFHVQYNDRISGPSTPHHPLAW